MAFPTVPTGGRIVTAVQANTTATRTFPNLNTLTSPAGELIIAIVIAYQSTATANAVWSSWTGGFTEFVDQSTTSTMAIGAAYKWSGGSETGTFAVTQGSIITGHAAMILISITGAHPSTVPESGTIINGTASAANIASLNPAGWGTEDTLWIAVCGSGEDATTGAFTAPSAGPTNYTTGFVATSLSSDVVGGVYGAIGFRQLNAASDDPATFTIDTSNARNSALLLAVRPIENTDLVVADSTQAQSTDSIALTQVHELVVNDSTQAQSTDAIALTQVHQLVVADATQAQSTDGIVLTQTSNLIVADATQAQSTDAIALTQVHALTVADTTQTQSTDAIALTQAHQLVVADSTQQQSTDSIALTQVHNLDVQDATQSQSTDSITLTQIYELIVFDALQNQTVDNLVLEQVAAGTNLVVHDAIQQQTSTSLDLTQEHELVVQDATQDQTADNLVIAQTITLAVQDALQSQTADTIIFTQSQNLLVDNSIQLQFVDNVAFGGISVKNARQTMRSDNLSMVTQMFPSKVVLLKHDVRKSVLRDFEIEYGARLPISSSSEYEIRYSVEKLVQKSVSVIYDSEIVGITQVSQRFEVKYHILNLAGQESQKIIAGGLAVEGDVVLVRAFRSLV